MATKRIKDISTTATTFAADDFIALDASSVGTRKMAKASLITQVGANYLEKADNLSDVADKDTAKLNLEIPNVGTAANEVPLSGMLNSGAWLDFDAFYETGTWTPTVSFGGGSTGITYSAQEGNYTRIGDTVHLAGIVQVAGLGSATGTARVSGLPYTTADSSVSFQTVPVLAFDATGLTSALIGLFEDNQPDIVLYQTGASGGSAASHSNFTTSTSIRFSGTYQIA
jgi:hypothetical protein